MFVQFFDVNGSGLEEKNNAEKATVISFASLLEAIIPAFIIGIANFSIDNFVFLLLLISKCQYLSGLRMPYFVFMIKGYSLYSGAYNI
ncbi:MAG: hypothetical protein SCABRO_03402 [Candidatus Scalindua brodae]|uniref:Uncharacterized protein n=1 Tax=Candidatus Scalindua brodae TaxID=237368 RepID=A0A0B0EIF2_9BACT|nr:MAG: hypothetical protein SCABRO_03402 [Candidatus Scalindua brodae]